jgi:hypothetical protein
MPRLNNNLVFVAKSRVVACVGYLFHPRGLVEQVCFSATIMLAIHLLGIRMDEPSSHYNDFLASSIGEGVRV